MVSGTVIPLVSIVVPIGTMRVMAKVLIRMADREWYGECNRYGCEAAEERRMIKPRELDKVEYVDPESGWHHAGTVQSVDYGNGWNEEKALVIWEDMEPTWVRAILLQLI